MAAHVSPVSCLQILESVRPAAARLGLETPLQLWSYFVATCKRNLHIVLCMSPIGDACRWVHGPLMLSQQHARDTCLCCQQQTLSTCNSNTVCSPAAERSAMHVGLPAHRRERLRANPSLVNCCTIDWLGPPPDDALEAVAHKQLSELANVDPDTRKTLVGMCQAIHVQVRALHPEPHFLGHRCVRGGALGLW